MRALRTVLLMASAASVLVGCSTADKTPAGAPTPNAVVEAEADTEPAVAEPVPEESVAEDYLNGDGPTDVASHMACTRWTEENDRDGLTGEVGMSVADRALRSDDPAMNVVAAEAGIGPILTDPWGMTELCMQHGYTIVEGSLAEEFYIDSLMGDD